MKCDLCEKEIEPNVVPFHDGKEGKDFHSDCHRLLELVQDRDVLLKLRYIIMNDFVTS